MQAPAYSANVPPPSAPGENGAVERMRVYTPPQVAMGALLGGPVGVICFLWANFRALERPAAAGRTIIWGSAGFVLVVVLIMLSPHGLTGLLLSLAYAVIAWQAAAHLQMTREAIDRSALHRRHSNWRVVGIGLLCSLLSMLFAFVFALVLQRLGMPIG